MMNVELIPVIEIGYCNQGISPPRASPYWEYPDEWQRYLDKCYEKAGFIDKLISYASGSGFYRARDISDNNLLKIINDHLLYLREKKISEEEVCALFGGYVLKIDGENKLFPQCCSDLSDIIYWKALINGEIPAFDNGHPSPSISFRDEKIIFYCNDKFEPFSPETDKEIIVPLEALTNAYRDAIVELEAFKKTIRRIENKLDYKTKTPLEEILIYNQ